MATEVRVYDMEDGHPCVVMVTSGTHDVSRLANLLHSGRCEDQTTATYIRKTLSRHRGGRAALKLLRDHGGPDLVVGTAPSDETRYLVWSHKHGLWWKANECGYTADIWTAGRYDKAGAGRASTAGYWTEDGRPDGVMVLAPEWGMDAMTLEEIRAVPFVMAHRIGEATQARMAERKNERVSA